MEFPLFGQRDAVLEHVLDNNHILDIYRFFMKFFNSNFKKPEFGMAPLTRYKFKSDERERLEADEEIFSAGSDTQQVIVRMFEQDETAIISVQDVVSIFREMAQWARDETIKFLEVDKIESWLNTANQFDEIAEAAEEILEELVEAGYLERV
jgi:hypothetical protein